MKKYRQLIYLLTAILTIVVLFLDSKFDINPALYEVKTVVDGDTLAVEMAGSIELVRFIGVNTPETHHPEIGAQCYGEEASQYLKDLIADNKVLLVADPKSTNRDRYDRLLRHVYVDNEYVNLKLVTEGYGFATVRFEHSFNEAFIVAERSAQLKKVGLWSACEITKHQDGYFQTQRLEIDETFQSGDEDIN